MHALHWDIELCAVLSTRENMTAIYCVLECTPLAVQESKGEKECVSILDVLHSVVLDFGRIEGEK